jgi:predicted lactoylglutathione lyase
MFHHIGIYVKNMEKSKNFYIEILKTIGYELNADYGVYCGFNNFKFGIAEAKNSNITNSHIAFNANNRNDVDSFYKKALEHGAKDNGKPGIRKQYGNNYYAAFVYDYDGNNIEIVCDK